MLATLLALFYCFMKLFCKNAWIVLIYFLSLYYLKNKRYMKQIEVLQAQQRALEYGWPGRALQSPNAKTGKFSGFWRSGRIAWSGTFVSGEQYSLWTYTSKDGKSNETHVYCNL